MHVRLSFALSFYIMFYEWSKYVFSNDYFKNIFNTVGEAIVILDENLRVLLANRSFFTIFEVDSESDNRDASIRPWKRTMEHTGPPQAS